MKKISLLILSLFLAFSTVSFANTSPVPERIEQQLIEQIKLEKYHLIDDRMVMIEKNTVDKKGEKSQYFGRGVILNSYGLILTAGHVIEEPKGERIKSIYVNGFRYNKPVKPEYYIIHPTKDLGLIRVKIQPDVNVDNLKFSEGVREEIDRIFLPIFNEYKEFDYRKDIGIGISYGFYTVDVLGLDLKQRVMSTTIIIRKGYSGSGIFDSNENLVGIVISIDTSTLFASAIGLEDLREGFKDLVKMESELLTKQAKSGR